MAKALKEKDALIEEQFKALARQAGVSAEKDAEIKRLKQGVYDIVTGGNE